MSRASETCGEHQAYNVFKKEGRETVEKDIWKT